MHISNIISKVNYKLSVMREIFKFIEIQTQTILMNSLVVSIFRYCCPLLINSNINMINQLQTILMKCTRHILGFISFKMSTIAIMKELKMVTIHQLLVKESILFIHKVNFNESPNSIFNFLSYSSNKKGNIRKVKKL